MPSMKMDWDGQASPEEIARRLTDVSDIEITRMRFEGDKVVVTYTENDHPSARYNEDEEVLRMVTQIFDALDDIYAARQRFPRERVSRRRGDW